MVTNKLACSQVQQVDRQTENKNMQHVSLKAGLYMVYEFSMQNMEISPFIIILSCPISDQDVQYLLPKIQALCETNTHSSPACNNIISDDYHGHVLEVI